MLAFCLEHRVVLCGAERDEWSRALYADTSVIFGKNRSAWFRHCIAAGPTSRSTISTGRVCWIAEAVKNPFFSAGACLGRFPLF
jgi:hypothetical protein